jgi:hypothetical protein
MSLTSPHPSRWGLATSFFIQIDVLFAHFKHVAKPSKQNRDELIGSALSVYGKSMIL